MNISKYIGETTAYDKKLMLERKDPICWLKSVSAFANTNGGVLIFDVDRMPRFSSDATDFYVVLPNLNYGVNIVDFQDLKLADASEKSVDQTR